MKIDWILEDAYKGKPVTREAVEVILSLERLPPNLLETVGSIRNDHRGEEFRFYYPLPKFPSVSVTGNRCALKCKHCAGHYLTHMFSAEKPSKLKRFCVELAEKGGTGVLISGGSNIYGRVPLEKFYNVLQWVKENTELIVNVHTGLMDLKMAEEIASTGIDIASVDIVGSDETINRVYGMKATVSEYWETLHALKEAQIPHVVPHICVGLDFGEIKGEARAFEMVQKFDPKIVVILGLMPTLNTPMEAVEPPSAEVLAGAVAAARLTCPKASIALGCMRPRHDKIKIEKLSIRAGADRMALPSFSTVKTARKNFNIKHIQGCCAIPTNLESSCLKEDRGSHTPF